MTLLSIDEVREGLEKEFLPLEPVLCGFRLIPASIPEGLMADCEDRLSVKFPANFRGIISSFDFGRLTIGPVVFCTTGDYLSELLELNLQVHWWGSGIRPSNLLMIANSDPYAILLDLGTCEVLSMDAEDGYQKSGKIARNFEKFLRGLGTIVLTRNHINDKRELAQSVFKDVEGQESEFWFELAQ